MNQAGFGMAVTLSQCYNMSVSGVVMSPQNKDTLLHNLTLNLGLTDISGFLSHHLSSMQCNCRDLDIAPPPRTPGYFHGYHHFDENNIPAHQFMVRVSVEVRSMVSKFFTFK